MSKRRRPDALPRWRAHYAAARAEIAAGRSRAAMAPLAESLSLNPDLAEGWRLLAEVLTAAGDMAGARRATLRELRARTDVPGLKSAADSLAAGRLEDAERGLAKVGDEHVMARRLAAEVLLRRGRPAEAESVLRRLPDAPELRQGLPLVLLTSRRHMEALAALDRRLTESPDDTVALAMKASTLTELGRHREAADASRAVVERFPDQPYARLTLARSLRAIGDSRGAIDTYRDCLAQDPACAEAWLGLADLRVHRFSSAEVALMRSAIEAATLDDGSRAKIGFALGQALEAQGDVAGAWVAFTDANQVEAARRGYDPDAVSQFVTRSIALYSGGFFAARAEWGARSADPIFVVGLPRSGSTLVEQILASHPSVEGLDELPELPILAATIADYPEGVGRLSRAECGALGQAYLNAVRQHRQTDRPRFVDKTPKNFLHAGLILSVLPKARIVDVRRHPLACGVSIFRQHFGLGFSCAFDLGHIGRYYADYVRLMAHLDTAAPGRIHRVIYEDLVADLEGETRRLTDYLGLSFDPACLRFFENRRPVTTPSSEQVRRPIFADALESWRRYETFLAPLEGGLGPALNYWRSVQRGG